MLWLTAAISVAMCAVAACSIIRAADYHKLIIVGSAIDSAAQSTNNSDRKIAMKIIFQTENSVWQNRPAHCIDSMKVSDDQSTVIKSGNCSCGFRCSTPRGRGSLSGSDCP